MYPVPLPILTELAIFVSILKTKIGIFPIFLHHVPGKLYDSHSFRAIRLNITKINTSHKQSAEAWRGEARRACIAWHGSDVVSFLNNLDMSKRSLVSLIIQSSLLVKHSNDTKIYISV